MQSATMFAGACCEDLTPTPEVIRILIVYAADREPASLTAYSHQVAPLDV